MDVLITILKEVRSELESKIQTARTVELAMRFMDISKSILEVISELEVINELQGS